MGARTGGGAVRVGARPSPPGKKIYFVIWWPFCNVFLQPFSPCVGTFLLLFLHVGGLFCPGSLFWAYPPPPTKIYMGAHEYRYGIAAHELEV